MPHEVAAQPFASLPDLHRVVARQRRCEAQRQVACAARHPAHWGGWRGGRVRVGECGACDWRDPELKAARAASALEEVAAARHFAGAEHADTARFRRIVGTDRQTEKGNAQRIVDATELKTLGLYQPSALRAVAPPLLQCTRTHSPAFAEMSGKVVPYPPSTPETYAAYVFYKYAVGLTRTEGCGQWWNH